jgi:hypothetical protein
VTNVLTLPWPLASCRSFPRKIRLGYLSWHAPQAAPSWQAMPRPGCSGVNPRCKCREFRSLPLPTACATTVGDMCASASGNSATPCVGTATNNTACDRTAPIDTANIGGATTARLVVRITISCGIVTAATGCNGSPSNDCATTIGGTASNCATTIGGTTSSCATSGAAALALDQYNLNVVRRNNFEGILWKDRNRRAHCWQDKQERARKPHQGQLEPQIARCHVVLLSSCSSFVGLTCRKPVRMRCTLSVGPAHYLLV